jgi:hypothetical protein
MRHPPSKGFQTVIRHICFLTMILLFPGMCSSANAQEPKTHCFAIRLTKNGKTVPGPNSVTFLDQTRKQDVEIRDGTFCVPELMADEPALDFTFVLGKERFFFPRLPAERFQASWDISFGPKKYARIEGMPKGTKASHVCIVQFNYGEPGTGMAMSSCRGPSKPLK